MLASDGGLPFPRDVLPQDLNAPLEASGGALPCPASLHHTPRGGILRPHSRPRPNPPVPPAAAAAPH
ncbi:hypothetical protein GTV15_08345 [Streptomyces sp. SID7803]|nr:hypothetical protein [Streptomyces sp. SID7803]